MSKQARRTSGKRPSGVRERSVMDDLDWPLLTVSLGLLMTGLVLVASASFDLAERLSGHTGSVVALAYRGDTLVSAGFDATVRVWRLRISASSEVRTPKTRVGRTEIFEIR